MDVAPWCFKLDGLDWVSPGWGRYREAYGANKSLQKILCKGTA